MCSPINLGLMAKIGEIFGKNHSVVNGLGGFDHSSAQSCSAESTSIVCRAKMCNSQLGSEQKIFLRAKIFPSEICINISINIKISSSSAADNQDVAFDTN